MEEKERLKMRSYLIAMAHHESKQDQRERTSSEGARLWRIDQEGTEQEVKEQTGPTA